MNHDFITIRALDHNDLDAVCAIQTACYPAGFHESRAVFARKLAVSPDSHWLAEHRGEPIGYFLTHPWAGDAPPDLDHELAGLPAAPDCHFLHDLALHPVARGKGLAPRLIEAALQWGAQQGYARTMLVAVQGSVPFWQRWGFKPVAAAAAYGKDAALMQRG
ncbi:hypothetical protein IGB42_00986 [Andreprevotia sp. IGB-42]|uniref:GNAT family N-acetyltransferase n=1 Tax=Andreprevotia sp. IGB-42 TaxID=2497473 RepID=UPI00135908DD|nr:GNAT family N-acetyltransferase [Andreprevotia sp. IGB-42]KAF0814089.1 hypothetical protein IGB42_00986 [Andreprevotia sp. IGB-42]